MPEITRGVDITFEINVADVLTEAGFTGERVTTREASELILRAISLFDESVAAFLASKRPELSIDLMKGLGDYLISIGAIIHPDGEVNA
jgi:hypothetical protein